MPGSKHFSVKPNGRVPVPAVIAFLSVIIVGVRIFGWQHSVLTWDIFGYYLYLPAKFIYHDLFLQNKEWLDKLLEQYQPTSTLYQAVITPGGTWAMKYPMGMALMYSPFFFLGHLIALLSGFPADGLSAPYQYTILAGGIITAVAGLWVLSKVLKHFFDPPVTNIVLLLIVAGTNYLQLTAIDGTLLSHNFLFLLYSLLLLFTIKWHEKQKGLYAIVAGALCGLITITRPSEAVCVLIPILWGVTTYRGALRKIVLIKSNPWQTRAFITAGLLAVLPQLLYWKAATGHYFFYSYTNAGEGFEFGHPFIVEFLFSFRKGWLLYTPLMGLALLGFAALYRYNRSLLLPLGIFLVLHLYVAASWTCWWYAGGSFSSRSMVPVYSVLALPLGYLIVYLKQKRARIKISASILVVMMVGLNLFQSWQFQRGIIDKERMTRAYYLSVFGKTEKPAGSDKLLLVERSVTGTENLSDTTDYISKLIYFNSFRKESPDTMKGQEGKFILSAESPFSPGPDLTYRQITNNDHAWLRISADVTLPAGFQGDLPLLVATFHHNGEPYKYFAKKVLLNLPDSLPATIHVTCDYLTPEVRSLSDNFKTYFWYQGGGSVQVANFRVKAFEKKID